jgi:hypothetical protein
MPSVGARRLFGVALAVALGLAPQVSAAQSSRDAQIAAVSDWIATACTGPFGTFRVHPHGKYVSGYFGNIISIGLIAAKTRPDLALEWMKYYVGSAHDSASGVDGVPDDVNIQADGSLKTRGRPDSTDAYGATFMMVSRAAFESGDPALRDFVLAHKSDVLRIGESSLATQQPNGLTWSRPQYRIAYAIDNMQVYRGMLDGAALVQEAFHDTATAARWRAAANKTAHGIATYLWEPATTSYRPYVNEHLEGPSADLSQPYPGALAQDMAIVYGLPDLTPQRDASILSRTFASMSSPLANDEREYRLLYDLAKAHSGPHVDVPPFTPSDVCVDAGWYLMLASF